MYFPPKHRLKLVHYDELRLQCVYAALLAKRAAAAALVSKESTCECYNGERAWQPGTAEAVTGRGL
jgi:hypothetical protein